MEEAIYKQELHQIICSNAWFMTVLKAVRDCAPPDWFVGAGVIRNVVWDHLHGYAKPTPLADVDVAFFDPNDLCPERDRVVQKRLHDYLPAVPWEATNQAAVHLWYEKAFGYTVPPLESRSSCHRLPFQIPRRYESNHGCAHRLR